MSKNITPEKTTTKKSFDYKYLRDKYKEKVKGKFINHEVPGGAFAFVFKEFPGEKVERYDMVDQQIYEVPLGVAKHLNKRVSYNVYGHLPGEEGIQGVGYKVSETVRRVSFQNLEWIDSEDLTPDGGIIKVEAAV